MVKIKLKVGIILMFLVVSTLLNHLAYGFEDEFYLKDGRMIGGDIIKADSATISVVVDFPLHIVKYRLNGDTTDIFIRQLSWNKNEVTFLRNDIKTFIGRAPGEAFFWAVSLGAIGHGFGHEYAGDILTSRILTISEGVSIICLVIGGFNPSKNAYWETGKYLFWGSWLYDVILAPFAASAHNKSIAKKYGLPVISYNTREQEIQVGYNFHF